RLVQTGLDLIDFPTIVWQEVEYSVYTMRQASRRSWRIGQRLPVRVVYLAYRGTLQAHALTLVAKKLKASLAVEGELDDEGLATFGDDGEDLLMALARNLTDRVEGSEESLEWLFASIHDYERNQDAVLDEAGFLSSGVEASRRLALPPSDARERPPHRSCTSLPAPIDRDEHRPVEATGLQLRLF
ncbi:MAG: hypothetical protein IT302_09325, partial [Dehalococcoidia bacterium]|nr:hypothetical protein [Dehalococcoidia bacterium]